MRGHAAATSMLAVLAALTAASAEQGPPARAVPPPAGAGPESPAVAFTAQAPPREPRDPAAPQGQRPTFRAEANYVRLDVYPTADGRVVADLSQDEFTVLEDGVPQRIASFEHVVVQASGPQETRAEPRTVRESREMARDPRARLFVLFLDTYHVSGLSGHQVRAPLTRMLDRAIGQDDLLAVMTPEMSAADITFARKTLTVEEILGKYWDYGKRHSSTHFDPEENNYLACYPPEHNDTMSDLAREMIDRRREKMTLDALGDLVVHLDGLREERKAVIAVSEGWALYRRNFDLARATSGGRVPGPPQVGVGPDGRLKAGDPRNVMGADRYRCDQDRIRLAQEDHDLDFRRLLDMANRANASFYPVDPRGLAVFDSPVGPRTPPSPIADQRHLTARIESLRTLAGATDGLAIVNSNDIDRGLRRVVDDLSSYYLLGYYSTNTRLDGRFRSVEVRVKRPGVSVRTRRGYLAPTREEVEARKAAGDEPGGAGSPVETAVAGLRRVREGAFVQAVPGYEWRGEPGSPRGAALWVHAELDPSAGSRDEQWKAGAEVTVSVTGPGKAIVGEARQVLSREARLARIAIPSGAPLSPGDYAVRIASKPVGASLGSSEVVHLTVPALAPGAAFAAGHPSLWRRGPYSGAGWQPAGDVRFRRQERVRVDVPVLGAFRAGGVRLLDRNGNPLKVPVAQAERQESGARVVAGELTLAPLAAGDYLLEVTLEAQGETRKILAAFRVIPG